MKKIHIPLYISWQIIVEKIYIIDERSKEIFILEDELSQKIWLSIYENKDFQNIIVEAVKKYALKEADIKKDCMEWVTDMLQNELLCE